MRPWVIVGAGRVGESLMVWADEHGREVREAWTRSEESARSLSARHPGVRCVHGALPDALSRQTEPCVVWVTVVDDALEEISARIRPWLIAGNLVLHTSGSLSSGVFASLDGVSFGSIHPLQAISDPVSAQADMRRCVWTVEGSEEAFEWGTRMLGEMGVVPVRMESNAKVLYHTSAVLAANLLVGLLDAAMETAARAGIADQETRRRMLLPLAESALRNLWAQSPRDALTGPVARGDASTIERHIDALEAAGLDGVLEVYEVLTRRAFGLTGAPTRAMAQALARGAIGTAGEETLE